MLAILIQIQYFKCNSKGVLISVLYGAQSLLCVVVQGLGYWSEWHWGVFVQNTNKWLLCIIFIYADSVLMFLSPCDPYRGDSGRSTSVRAALGLEDWSPSLVAFIPCTWSYRCCWFCCSLLRFPSQFGDVTHAKDLSKALPLGVHKETQPYLWCQWTSGVGTTILTSVLTPRSVPTVAPPTPALISHLGGAVGVTRPLHMRKLWAIQIYRLKQSLHHNMKTSSVTTVARLSSPRESDASSRQQYCIFFYNSTIPWQALFSIPALTKLKLNCFKNKEKKEGKWREGQVW